MAEAEVVRPDEGGKEEGYPVVVSEGWPEIVAVVPVTGALMTEDV